jgi:predicted negative regulator of RcsB-dependent stress response
VSVKSLLEKLNAFLSEEHQAQLAKHKSLKKVLKALRREKAALRESMANTEDEAAKKEIEGRLKIVSAQRKKGLKVLKKLKSERRTKS